MTPSGYGIGGEPRAIGWMGTPMLPCPFCGNGRAKFCCDWHVSHALAEGGTRLPLAEVLPHAVAW